MIETRTTHQLKINFDRLRLINPTAEVGTRYLIKASSIYGSSVTCRCAKITLLSRASNVLPEVLGEAILTIPLALETIELAANKAHKTHEKIVELDCKAVETEVRSTFNLAKQMSILPDEILNEILSRCPERGNDMENQEFDLYMFAKNEINHYTLLNLSNSRKSSPHKQNSIRDISSGTCLISSRPQSS